MSEQIAAESLLPGMTIDLVPTLDDTLAHPWVWQPFGDDEQGRQDAIETARMVASYELAVVEAVEVDPLGGTFVYTDQINVTVPHGHLITVEG